MAQQDDGQEKTLDPTPQRIARARREGDVPRSQDLNTVAGYLGFLLALTISGGAVAAGVAEPIFAFIAHPHELSAALLSPRGRQVVYELIGGALFAMAPLLLAPMFAVLISAIAQQSIVIAPNRIAPKLSRLNPIKNAGQKFGASGLVEFLKSFVKLLAVGVILAVIIAYKHDGVAGLIMLDARLLPQLLYDEGLTLLIATLIVMGLIAFIDVFWQQHQYYQKLRMSLQEVKDEAKDSEGDPQMKATRRQRAREIAGNRSLNDVPDADVVIVNPTHYAIALKWSRTPGAAPVCVAKGVDLMAARIREIATESGVPIHSDPPTARALHAAVEIGDEIQPEYYQAVAVAIRFADTVRAQAR
ncbi:MAG: flagellar type III secretion system protein FlhB [Neomegalonema sp.]|nr:flagellar type III secretion system protein FlhB [Neomegalonema sp.]